MKRVIDSSEVLGTVATADGECELCAEAAANYDDKARQLVVILTAVLRTTDLRTPERCLTPVWLPAPEVIRESVDSSEGHDVARDIFHRWVRKLRQVTPGLRGVA